MRALENEAESPTNPLPYAEAVARLAEAERAEGWLLYCERRNLYQLPVTEWLDALVEEISALAPRKPLEVGCGDAAIGKALRARGVNLLLTDPAGGAGIEALGAREALAVHAPDFVLSCWPPFDAGVEREIRRAKSVRTHLAVVQRGPGFAGSEALWNAPGWNARELHAVNLWAVSRADFLSRVDAGEHVRNGVAWLFTREG